MRRRRNPFGKRPGRPRKNEALIAGQFAMFDGASIDAQIELMNAARDAEEIAAVIRQARNEKRRRQTSPEVTELELQTREDQLRLRLFTYMDGAVTDLRTIRNQLRTITADMDRLREEFGIPLAA